LSAEVETCSGFEKKGKAEFEISGNKKKKKK